MKKKKIKTLFYTQHRSFSYFVKKNRKKKTKQKNIYAVRFQIVEGVWVRQLVHHERYRFKIKTTAHFVFF